MDPVRARAWEAGGRWYARIEGAPVYVEVTGVTREQCLAELRTAVGDETSITVDVVPAIAGVAEAAEILGWDKRRIVTYVNRGSFPEPLTTLASGRIWLRDDVEAFAREWRERHPTARGSA